ncbi:MAG: acriflavin resistance protein [Bacteroidetes bacterium GWC2_33_15]|nr:MAG: acriflavin resistance protein [Bacteroidetes bacterium GWA2_33_15]OFX51508.1 MAG: acriflavin resistance protein [Bacteroidetes bacterium GWC2_33_15]OFX65745.1 MAG: acriflavin resistance protein [Bacteroidetes bacterium GWB2_32_14]OFX69536.1 MAG: acriflavin resistance protein [Bacteroidetes bacterium GWD2_33_33]HAN17794.1 acriflavin resistance protein [Bacteroidales bacterium]
MNISSLSIRRPVLSLVMTIIIILFGAIGMSYLGVREFPNVDRPIVSVSTSYVGANSDVIDTQITEPLEQAINGIPGINSMSSSSRDGSSRITIEFDLNVDLETAANDVRDKVAAARRQLPSDAEPPVVVKADADSDPIIFLNIMSDKRSMIDLSDIAENVFKEKLQTIPGVSSVAVWGSKRPAMRLWMNPSKLAAYQLTPVDVRNALTRENIELPSGRIEGNMTELTVRTVGRLVTPDDFNNLILRQTGDKIIRFKDIGRAELGPENERTGLLRDGIPSVGNAVIPQPGSNHIEIVDEVYKRLEQIKKDLPADIKVDVGFDNTTYIRQSITEVEETILLAFLLVVLIIFLFLRDWRTTLIPVIAIPVSLIGAFFILYLAGYTINVLTLLGIVLSIGLVVDDAIIVLENIYAKIERGMEPREAAMKGSAEIFFAVIATTITLIAVFTPIVFLKGTTGRLFKEFSIVISGAVIISAFIALTLTPMLSSRLLKPRQKHTWLYRKTEPFFNSLINGYSNSLEKFMNRRWLALLFIGITLVLIVVLYQSIPSEMAPLEDRSSLSISSTGPEGASYEFMNLYMTELSQLVEEKVPEKKGMITIISPGWSGTSNNGAIRLILKDRNEREKSQQEIADLLSKEVKDMSAARTFISQQQTIGGRRGGLPVQFVIQAQNLEKLKDVLPEFMIQASSSEIFQFVDLNLKFNKPEIRVEINRDKAVIMGVSMQNVAQTLQLALSGSRFGYFVMNGKQYQVLGQLERENRNKPLDLKSIYVKNNAGEMIQLDNLITLREESSPPQLYRYNRYMSATISAGMVKGKTLGEGIKEMEAIADRVLDDTYSTALAGDSKDFEESSSSLLFAFVLALVLIYLILSAQFESFRDPLIIMFTVPLALTGALVFLWYFNYTMNIFSQIGIIMLIGLVSKNGILLVEFANQRKSTGLSKNNAMLEAAAARFRPILMTSLSTILGTLPIALALGSGAGSRVSMGVAVVGGLFVSTFFTLYVVPAMYSYISEKSKSVTNVEDTIQN